MLHLEAEVKNLHAAVEQIQVTLASPDLHRLSLREQLTQRQVNIHVQTALLLERGLMFIAFIDISKLLNQRLLVEMEGFKQKVVAVQQSQSALWLPEEVVASLPICRTAQSLQQEASQLQHTTIQQCNILQVECSFPQNVANFINHLSHLVGLQQMLCDLFVSGKFTFRQCNSTTVKSLLF